MTTDRHFLFLCASARPNGNSLMLARRAAAALPAEVVQTWRDLNDPALPAFHDRRHGDHYDAPEGVAAALMADTLAASDIVFVAPLYWYGLPAAAKLYLDHWSHWMRVPATGFKAAMPQKRVWLVMAHSGSTPAQIAPAVDCLRFSADYMHAPLAGVLLGDANAPGAVADDLAAIAAADRFFTT
ncbi:MAG: flavodoxin [Rhodobacteraceae bacterium]|nr:flavodoxin [Paracoccaceae bacterium]